MLVTIKMLNISLEELILIGENKVLKVMKICPDI